MSLFKLSLRDLFFAITAICAQFGLLAIFFGLTEEGRNWFVMILNAATVLLIPIALAAAMANVKRRMPLFSGLLAFIVTLLLLASQRGNLVYHLLTLAEIKSDARLYTLVVTCGAVTTGLICAWITRSLSSADDSTSTASGS